MKYKWSLQGAGSLVEKIKGSTVLLCKIEHQWKPFCMLYSKRKKKMTPYLYEQEKKEICPCARGRREGERWDASLKRIDYLAVSHPAKPTLVVPAWQREILSPMGSEHGRGLAGAEATFQGPENIADALGGKPRFFCREGEWDLTAETVVKLYSTVFNLGLFFFDWISAGKQEKPNGKKQEMSHLLPFSFFSRVEKLQKKYVAKRSAMWNSVGESLFHPSRSSSSQGVWYQPSA